MDAQCAVYDAVEYGINDGLLSYSFVLLLDRYLRGNNRGSFTVTVFYDVYGQFSDRGLLRQGDTVFGDTMAVKDTLRALGGRFNKFLTLNGARRAGWVFQKSKEQELKTLLAIN